MTRAETEKPLKIIHCFRSPVGGIFRHVRDLVNAHHDEGHQLGIFCDSLTGGAHEDRLFEEIRPKLALGLTRIPMRRAITPADAAALWRSYRHFAKLQPDILHSHGAKGGAYARIIGSLLRVSGTRVARLYCPHGGSIHYDAGSMKGKLFFSLERFMERMSDRLIFVSKYEQDGYEEKVGKPRCPASLVYNGLSEAEFVSVPADGNARDFLYIGMMRDLKGPDVFIDAMAQLVNEGFDIKAHFVGDGPDKPAYVEAIATKGLGRRIAIHDAMPARKAFAMAKCVIVPSRAESMPYIVLEAIAAGKPVICTRVGGIPEIFAGDSGHLVEPGSVPALASAMRVMKTDPDASAVAVERQERLKQRFSVDVMARDVMKAYRECLV